MTANPFAANDTINFNCLTTIKMGMEYIYFNTRDELLRLRTDRIAFFESDGNYTLITTVNNLTATVCMNLGDIERLLATYGGDTAHMFIRIGKRHIINSRLICHVNLRKQELTLTDFGPFTKRLTLSKEALKKLKTLITSPAK